MDTQKTSPVEHPLVVPVVSPLPVLVPPKKNLKSLLWILLFLVILLSATTAFFIYQNFQLRQQLVSQPTPVPSAVVSPTADPTADWKTYINTKYRYYFKYPTSLKIFESPVVPEGSVQVGSVISFFSADGRKERLAFIEALGKNNNTFEPPELQKIDFLGKEYAVTKVIFGEGTPDDRSFTDPKFKDCSNTGVASDYFFDYNEELIINISSIANSKCDDAGKMQVVDDSFDNNVKVAKQILFTFKFIE